MFSLCVGLIARAQYGNDVQIRVFDLRMNRMVAPLQVAAPSTSASGVGFLRLIPEMDTNPVEFASVLMCTADGVVQVIDGNLFAYA